MSNVNLGPYRNCWRSRNDFAACGTITHLRHGQQTRLLLTIGSFFSKPLEVARIAHTSHQLTQSRRSKQQTASIPRKLPDSEIPPLNLNAGHTILGSVEILVTLVIRQNDFSNLLCGIALIGAIACNH